MPAQPVHKVTSEFLSFMTPASGNLYLIALNYTLPRPTLRLWSTATFRICADGGANRLYDEMGTIPHLTKRSSTSAERPLPRHQLVHDLQHNATSQQAAATAQPLSHAKTHSTTISSSSSSPSHTGPPASAPSSPSIDAPYLDLTAASLDLMAASLDLNGSRSYDESAGPAITHPASTSLAESLSTLSPTSAQTGSEQMVDHAYQPTPSLPPPSDENTCASDASEADSSISGIPEVSTTSMRNSGGAALMQLLQQQDSQQQQQQQQQDSQQQQQREREQLLLPDLIQGDMDSIRADVLDYYTRHGVPHRDLRLDQDSTDLMKCLHFIQDELLLGDTEPTRHTVLVLGAIGGRLDHTLSNLGVLHMFPSLSIVLWGDGNLVRLLPPGRSVITPDQRFEGPKCGLVPICGGITATTTGLKWNCDNLQLKVGGLLSTSNELAGGDVCVETDGPVLWMTEVSDQAVMCTE